MELKDIRFHFKKWHNKSNKDFDDFTLEENILHDFDKLINDRDKVVSLLVEIATTHPDTCHSTHLINKAKQFLQANSPDKDYEAEKDAFIKMNHESLANSPDKEEKTNKAKKFDKSRCSDCGKIWAWNGDDCPMCGSGNIADIIIDRDR